MHANALQQTTPSVAIASARFEPLSWLNPEVDGSSNIKQARHGNPMAWKLAP
jgi:hypothetical protein